MNTLIPKIIIFVLYGANLLIAANEHGKVKKTKGNFWLSFRAVTLMTILMLWSWSWSV